MISRRKHHKLTWIQVSFWGNFGSMQPFSLLNALRWQHHPSAEHSIKINVEVYKHSMHEKEMLGCLRQEKENNKYQVKLPKRENQRKWCYSNSRSLTNDFGKCSAKTQQYGSSTRTQYMDVYTLRWLHFKFPCFKFNAGYGWACQTFIYFPPGKRQSYPGMIC